MLPAKLDASPAGPTCSGTVEPCDDGKQTITIGQLELRLVRCRRCGRKTYLSPAIETCPRIVRE